MKLIIFSDLHYYGGDRATAIFGKSKKLTQYAPAMLEQLIAKVNNEYKPDAVVNLGDSIQDANNHDADAEGLAFIAKKMKEFDCPCYTVLGNHDMKMFESKDEIAAIFGYEKFTYSLDLAGYHLVFMTNDLKPELGTAGGGTVKTHAMAEEDIAWLREDLQKNDKPCILFTHYTFVGDVWKSPYAVVKNKEELLEIMDADENLLAVFSGHTHKAYYERREGTEFHILGSPTADLTECGTPDAVYYEVDVCGREVKVTEHLFEVGEIAG